MKKMNRKHIVILASLVIAMIWGLTYTNCGSIPNKETESISKSLQTTGLEKDVPSSSEEDRKKAGGCTISCPDGSSCSADGSNQVGCWCEGDKGQGPASCGGNS